MVGNNQNENLNSEKNDDSVQKNIYKIIIHGNI